MKTLSTLPLCLAGALAGTGLGWLLRGAPERMESSPAGASAAGAAESASSPLTKRGGRAGGEAAGPAGDKLGAELARHTGAMRWLYFLGAADKATAADMPGLLRAAGGDQIALRMLAVRWAELDPRHMFETLCADFARHAAGGTGIDLSAEYQVRHILFEEWAKKDRDAAIAALDDRRVLPGVESLRYSLTNTIMKSDPARGLKLMTEWNITSFLPDMSGVGKWAQRDPRAAAEAVFANSVGHAGDDAMQKIGKAWAASDPVAALAFAAERRGLSGVQLAQSVMKQWAERDLRAAIDHVTAQSDSIARARLGLPLLEAWASTDAQSALQWAQEYLKGEARTSAAASIVKAMAARDIDAASAFIAGLDPGGVKNRAAAQLIETWLARDTAADTTAALAWMASLPEADARDHVFQQASWRLFYRNADETIAWLNSDQGRTAPQSLFDRAAQHMAGRNPQSAMEWATSLPADRAESARRSVLIGWVTHRPEAAADWVRQLPPGRERTQSVTAMAGTLPVQAFEHARQWLAALPAADHAAARAGLRHAVLPSDQMESLAAILR